MGNGGFFSFGAPDTRTPQQILDHRKAFVAKLTDARVELQKAQLALREVYAMDIDDARLTSAREGIAVTLETIDTALRKELGGS